MSKMKIFTHITPKDFDVIQHYYDYLKPSFGTVDIINIYRDYPEKINRTYCRCGYTSAKLEDECPVCGNNHKATFSISRSGTTLGSQAFMEKDIVKTSSGIFEECVSGYRNSWKCEVSPSTEFEFIEILKEKEFSIGSEFTVETIPRDYKLDEFMNLYMYDTEKFKYYDEHESISKFNEYLNLKSKYPVLMDAISEAPSIVNHIINTKTIPTEYTHLKSFDKVYDDMNIPVEFRPYVKNFYVVKQYYFSRSSAPETDIFDSYNSLDPSLKQIAAYILIHGDINSSTFKSLTELIVDKIDVSEAKVLMYYVRMNYLTSGTNVINDYIKKREFLLSEGYDVNIQNIDTRNFNLIKAKKYITETKKYNEEKTMYFLNMFDINPLESLECLSTRRAPNKQQKAELAKKLD